MLVTDGWRLFKPDQQLIDDALREQYGKDGWIAPTPPPVGIQPGGKLAVNTVEDGNFSRAVCDAELTRLGSIDDERLFRDIMTLARRTNVVFYPVNAGGLEVFDRTSAQMSIPISKDIAWHSVRVESAQVLAANTDGIAVVNTNDLRSGLNRIVNDVSAYYLLGYYSTNSKADGKFREITVRVKQPDVKVVARRGYVASTAADAGRGARDGASTSAPAAIDVTAALKALPLIDATDVFAYGIAAGSDLLVVSEISARKAESGQWTDGGAVKVVVTDVKGDPAGTATGRIEPGTRSVLIRVPLGSQAGPWRVGVTMTGTAGTLDERCDVRAGTGRLLSDPIAYRGASSARSVLRPVADFLFHRTERLRLEFGTLTAIERRTARVLDMRGQPLALDVTLTERDDNGRTLIVTDLNLAPLSPGDYVLELSAGNGTENERRLVAFRLVR